MLVEIDLSGRGFRTSKNIGIQYALVSGCDDQELELVDCSRNNLSVCPEVFDSGNLLALDLSRNPLNHIDDTWCEHLGLYTGIMEIRLRNTAMECLSCLGQCQTLEHIDVSFNNIKNVRGLELLADLKSLRIADNLIATVQGLRTLVFNTNLVILDVAGNPLSRRTDHRRSHIVTLYASRFTRTPGDVSLAMREAGLVHDAAGVTASDSMAFVTPSRDRNVFSSFTSPSPPSSAGSPPTSSSSMRHHRATPSQLDRTGRLPDKAKSAEAIYKGTTLRKKALSKRASWSRPPSVVPRAQAPPPSTTTRRRAAATTDPRMGTDTGTGTDTARRQARGVPASAATSSPSRPVVARLFEDSTAAMHSTPRSMRSTVLNTSTLSRSTTMATGTPAASRPSLATPACSEVDDRTHRLYNRESHEKLGLTPRWLVALMGGDGVRSVRPTLAKKSTLKTPPTGLAPASAAAASATEETWRSPASVAWLDTVTPSPASCDPRRTGKAGGTWVAPAAGAAADGELKPNIFYASSVMPYLEKVRRDAGAVSPPRAIAPAHVPAAGGMGGELPEVGSTDEADDDLAALALRAMESINMLTKTREAVRPGALVGRLA